MAFPDDWITEALRLNRYQSGRSILARHAGRRFEQARRPGSGSSRRRFPIESGLLLEHSLQQPADCRSPRSAAEHPKMATASTSTGSKRRHPRQVMNTPSTRVRSPSWSWRSC